MPLGEHANGALCWQRSQCIPRGGKCGGRKTYAEARPDTVALARQLHGAGLSYRKIAAELATQGHVTRSGKAHVASAVQKMLGQA